MVLFCNILDILNNYGNRMNSFYLKDNKNVVIIIFFYFKVKWVLEYSFVF